MPVAGALLESDQITEAFVRRFGWREQVSYELIGRGATDTQENSLLFGSVGDSVCHEVEL